MRKARWTGLCLGLVGGACISASAGEEGVPCSGGATSLMLRYTGASAAEVIAKTTGGTELFSAMVSPGGEFGVTGMGVGGRIGNGLELYINGVLNTTLDTGCACCTAEHAEAPVDLDDLRRVIEGYGEAAPTMGIGGDVNGDGRVDGSDVMDVLDGAPAFLPLGPVSQRLLYQDFEQSDLGGYVLDGFQRRGDCEPEEPGAAAFCVGDFWAYNGADGVCTLRGRTPTPGAGASEEGLFVSDLLQTPPVDIPDSSDECARAMLRFDAAINYRRSSSYFFTEAMVCVNDDVVLSLLAGYTYAWQECEVDLTPYLGQEITISFRYETNDPWFSGPSGMYVDNIEVTFTTGAAVCIGTGLAQGDFEVVAGESLAGPLGPYGVCCTDDEPGACCLGDGTCEEAFNAQTCYGQGGLFAGPGTLCSAVECVVRNGACCIGEFECMDLIYEDCLLASGQFQGPGTACAEARCDIVACCFEESSLCLDLTITNCKSAVDTVLGPAGSRCATANICPGACCFPDGSCKEVSKWDCIGAGGSWTAPGIECGMVLCVATGACCFLDGTCVDDELEADCLSADGDFHPGKMCSEIACRSQGACCFCDGNCEVLPEIACERAGGTGWAEGLTCTNVICIPFGACCLPDGTCEFLSEGACLSEGGGWQECLPCRDVLCESPTVACCLPDGSCADLAEATCIAMGGSLAKAVCGNCSCVKCVFPAYQPDPGLDARIRNMAPVGGGVRIIRTYGYMPPQRRADVGLR